MSDTEVKVKKPPRVKVVSRNEIAPPKMFKVIFLNDDATTVEFVVECLTTIFDHTIEVAVELTEKIHLEGSAVVGVFPYEIAEHKGVEITMAARTSGFPLEVKIEPDE